MGEVISKWYRSLNEKHRTCVHTLLWESSHPIKECFEQRGTTNLTSPPVMFLRHLICVWWSVFVAHKMDYFLLVIRNRPVEYGWHLMQLAKHPELSILHNGTRYYGNRILLSWIIFRRRYITGIKSTCVRQNSTKTALSRLTRNASVQKLTVGLP